MGSGGFGLRVASCVIRVVRFVLRDTRYDLRINADCKKLHVQTSATENLIYTISCAISQDPDQEGNR
jgi:hypothetical protein